MKVEVLVNLGTNEFPETPFCEGETHEVDGKLGAKLVAQRLAREIPEEPKADKFTTLRKLKTSSDSNEEK